MRTKFLSRLARLVVSRPWTVLIVAGILTLTSLFLAKTRLQMNTDQDDLVSEKLAYHKNYKDYVREFGDQEYLYVVVEAKENLPKAKEFTKALSIKLAEIPEIKEITYQVTNPKLEKSFLLYLPTDQLKSIGEFIPKMERITGVADVFQMMNGEIGGNVAAKLALQDSSRASSAATNMETGFRFLDNLLDGLISATKDDKPYQPFLQQAFFGGDRAYDEDGFLLSDNGNLLFIMIMPEKNYKTLAVIDEPLKKVRSALEITKKDFPEIKAGLTGRPVLAADEMKVSDTDMTIATIAALIIVTLIFIVYFRRPTRPFMAAIALVCGIAQTFGIATVVIGHLNILSIVFAVILVGAGIEFGLQIVSRYREELEKHKDVALAIETCITTTGKGNMTACATTAAAFFATCFTNFLALQELGFIAGVGIIMCLVNMFTVLPALICIRDRNKPPEKLHTTLRINLNSFEWIYNRPKIIITITAIITTVALFGLFKIQFNHNLLELQSKGLESVQYEKKIIEESTQSTWYVPFIVSSREESMNLAEKLKKLPTVGRVETIADVVPNDQIEKIKIISGFKNQLNGKNVSSVKLVPELEKFKNNISRLSEMAFSSGKTDAVEALEAVSKKTDELIQLSTGHEVRISTYETAFMQDLKKHIEMLKSGFSPEMITIDDMPSSIKRRYISDKTGRFTVYAYPKYDIWQPKLMAAFIDDIRSIDPNVTGVPVEVYESSKLLEKSFKQSALFSMLAIIIILLLDFRSLKFASLAILPLFLGVLWLFEMMGILGIRFNLANFFGIPILLGVGVDNAVQIVHRYIKDKHIESVTSFMTRSTGIAVLLTSITTLASFGTLIFARHQGIASLGLIMSLGTITCFVGSMILLPCVLKLIR